MTKTYLNRAAFVRAIDDGDVAYFSRKYAIECIPASAVVVVKFSPFYGEFRALKSSGRAQLVYAPCDSGSFHDAHSNPCFVAWARKGGKLGKARGLIRYAETLERPAPHSRLGLRALVREGD